MSGVDVAACLEVFAAALEPRPKLTVSQWAERYRVLPAKGAAEPGPWRNSRTPYLVEPMDCLSSHHPAEVVVLMFGSQLGKSEAINNFVGYVIDHAPGPMLFVQPTEGVAEQYSKQRLAPLCEQPPIAGKVKDPRDRDSGNTTLQKEYPGGTLVLRGANSAAGLAGMPMQYAAFDEADRFPDDVADEGDPITVGSQRTRTFAHSRKIIITSTPTVKGSSRVDDEFQRTDQRRYHVPCPECGTFQVLQWTPTADSPGGVVWDPSDPAGTARYQCGHCPARIHPSQRDRMVAQGVWKASAPAGDGKRVGFHLSALVSPWVTWGELAAMFLEAKRAGPVKLKAFVNLQLGEPWDAGEVASVEAKGLELRCERGWGAGRAVEVPAGVAVLTAGVDIQPQRGCVVIEVVGWGEGLESWSVDYLTIDGDPTNMPPKGVWAELEAALSRRYSHPVLGEIGIKAVCIDTGASTQNVYRFVKPRQRRRWWGVKGREDHGQPIWPAKPSKAGGIELRSINVDQAKEDVYWRLRVREPGPNFCHFPTGRDPAYFEELTAETLRTVYRQGRGRKQWVLPDGKRNEALDVRVYAYAAVLGLVAQRAVRLTAPSPKRQVAAQEPPRASQVDTRETRSQDAPGARAPASRNPAPPARRPRRGGWWDGVLDGW